MESNSKANRIMCSERSYLLLRDQLPSMKTKSGGKIAVKGKGDMYVYWIGDDLLRNKRQNRGGSEKRVGFFMDEPSERDLSGHFSEHLSEPDTDGSSRFVDAASDLLADADFLE